MLGFRLGAASRLAELVHFWGIPVEVQSVAATGHQFCRNPWGTPDVGLKGRNKLLTNIKEWVAWPYTQCFNLLSVR